MIETVLLVLLILYVAGLLTGTTVGGAIHVLLVVFLVLLVLRFLSGPRRRGMIPD